MRIHLQRENNAHYIFSQEDFYHPDEFTALLVPPLVPLVRFASYSATTIGGYNAKFASALLGWNREIKTNDENGTVDGDDTSDATSKRSD